MCHQLAALTETTVRQSRKRIVWSGPEGLTQGVTWAGQCVQRSCAVQWRQAVAAYKSL
jgi:hypothetical protein